MVWTWACYTGCRRVLLITAAIELKCFYSLALFTRSEQNKSTKSDNQAHAKNRRLNNAQT